MSSRESVIDRGQRHRMWGVYRRELPTQERNDSLLKLHSRKISSEGRTKWMHRLWNWKSFIQSSERNQLRYLQRGSLSTRKRDNSVFKLYPRKIPTPTRTNRLRRLFDRKSFVYISERNGLHWVCQRTLSIRARDDSVFKLYSWNLSIPKKTKWLHWLPGKHLYQHCCTRNLQHLSNRKVHT